MSLTKCRYNRGISIRKQTLQLFESNFYFLNLNFLVENFDDELNILIATKAR